jgi:dihydroorotate dehydrogenase electron transfer subunit
MHEYATEISRIEHRGLNVHTLDLHAPEIAREAEPGRFVQVRVSAGTDPFLRRSFSICGVRPDDGTVTLLVDVIGRGTELLCDGSCGPVSVLGPLGRGFDVTLGGDGHCVLIGGGTGAAPLAFLAERFDASGRPVTAYFGGRTGEYRAVVDGLLPDGVPWETAADDGSAGFHGTVTDLAAARFSDGPPSAIYACGPHPMLASVAAMAAEYGIPCEVSLEENMACGLGVCMGCAVKLKTGAMVRSCVDGPVFNAREVAW